MYLLRLFRIQPEKHTFFYTHPPPGKRKSCYIYCILSRTVASDPASESVSVDAPAKKADSYYYGITFYSYPGFGRKEKVLSAPFS